MRLKLDTPTKLWAYVKAGSATLCTYDKLKPWPGFEEPGETIERVLVTVTRVPAKRGKQ